MIEGGCYVRSAYVNFVARDVAGATIAEGAFEVRVNFAGEPGEIVEFGERILYLAGQELGRRLASGAPGSYFAARTRERDGMDAKAYAAYIEEKAELTAEARRAEKSPTISIADSSKALEMGSGNLMVLGVGIDEYGDERFPDLQYAAEDCRRVVEWFAERCALGDDRATCLTNADATAIGIHRFLKQTAALRLEPDDTFVFYFSGHGAPDPTVQSTDTDGLDKYLLLSESEPGALSLTALNLMTLFEQIDALPTRRNIVLIDSSFTGEAGRQLMAGLKGIRLSQRTYHNVVAITGQGTVLFAASAENESGMRRDALGASLFTQYLLEGLNGAADVNDNDRVDVLELHRFIRKGVQHDSAGEQTPILRGSLETNIEF